MTHRKKSKSPELVVIQSKKATKSFEQVWQQVGPLLAGILARTINDSRSLMDR